MSFASLHDLPNVHQFCQGGDSKHMFSQFESILLGNVLVALVVVCGYSSCWSAVSRFY